VTKSAIDAAGVLCNCHRACGCDGPLLGIMKIAEDSGLMSLVQKPSLRSEMLFRIFPAGHPAMASMNHEILRQYAGLSNAATPLGLKPWRISKSSTPIWNRNQRHVHISDDQYRGTPAGAATMIGIRLRRARKSDGYHRNNGCRGGQPASPWF